MSTGRSDGAAMVDAGITSAMPRLQQAQSAAGTHPHRLPHTEQNLRALRVTGGPAAAVRYDDLPGGKSCRAACRCTPAPRSTTQCAWTCQVPHWQREPPASSVRTSWTAARGTFTQGFLPAAMQRLLTARAGETDAPLTAAARKTAGRRRLWRPSPLRSPSSWQRRCGICASLCWVRCLLAPASKAAARSREGQSDVVMADTDCRG